jgi:hypothetical protein
MSSPPIPFLAPPTPEDSAGPFLTDKLSDLSKWAASGFALLASVLSFLGIKEGYLDRIIAESAQASVFVFTALGLGVLASLIAASTNPLWNVYAVWMIAAVLGLAVTTYLAVPDIDGDNAPTTLAWVGLGIGVALVIYAFANREYWKLALPVALLLIAVTATSAGLYSAVKISVASKALPEDLEVGTPTVRVVNGLAQVLVSLKGSQQTYRAGLVQVTGVATDRDGSIQIGTKRYRPDETNGVEQTLPFPLAFRPWQSITVSRCEFAKGANTCAPAAEGTYAVDASLFSSSVTATMRPRGRLVEAGTVGRSVPKSHYLRFKVWRSTGKEWRRVMQAEIAPSSSGVARWTSRLPATERTRWKLQVQVCGPQRCRSDLTRTAIMRSAG